NGEKTNSPSPQSPSPTGVGDSLLGAGEKVAKPDEMSGSGLKSPVSDLVSCPSCGQPMILRTSKRGANAGSQFWGCSTYPKCKGIRKYS
ncbi:MAG TPA: topoisomerase DNA-binding C4 zinc finger domain-containing protein, partial [Dongiaceae bacterium]|nr:topoisomerase DNA-binding C4 zinc finger domain-containing protein [Dongiaceae bacterium]